MINREGVGGVLLAPDPRDDEVDMALAESVASVGCFALLTPPLVGALPGRRRGPDLSRGSSV
jgi:hypothetical protein